MRLPLPLTFRHWAGVSPYTSPFGLAETCGFVNQSPEPFHCDLPALHLNKLHARRRPFSRSYGAILPSSLTRVLPFALVCSTRLPVSVCGTGTQVSSLRGFSWQQGSTTYGSRASASRLTSGYGFSCTPQRLHAYNPHNQSRAGLPRCVTPSLHLGGSGMLTGCPSPTPFGLG